MTAYQISVMQLSLGRRVEVGATESVVELYEQARLNYVLVGVVIVGAFLWDASRGKL